MRVGMQRLLFSILPALILVALGTAIVFGHNGLMNQWNLQSEMRAANVELAGVERENHALLREIRLMERDEIVVERVLAEQLDWAREGSVIYRFVDEATPLPGVAAASGPKDHPVP